MWTMGGVQELRGKGGEACHEQWSYGCRGTPRSSHGEGVSGAVSRSVRQWVLRGAYGAAGESNGEEVEGVLANPSKCNVSKYKLPSHSSLLLTDTLVFTDAALTGSALRASP